MAKQRTWRRWIIGIVLLLVLAVLSVSRYQSMIQNSREAILKTNLVAMRNAIENYTSMKRRAPQSLNDLVEAGYFPQLPIDPFTNSNSSWTPVMGTVITSTGESKPGITDLHSGSSSISSNGTAYKSW